jgi:hypothetical protein
LVSVPSGNGKKRSENHENPDEKRSEPLTGKRESWTPIFRPREPISPRCATSDSRWQRATEQSKRERSIRRTVRAEEVVASTGYRLPGVGRLSAAFFTGQGASHGGNSGGNTASAITTLLGNRAFQGGIRFRPCHQKQSWFVAANGGARAGSGMGRRMCGHWGVLG